MSIPAIGSEGWQGAEQLLDCGEIEELVTRCLENTRWDNLCGICSSIREGIVCKVSEKFSIGTENLVRLIEFEDGVRWVARIWMLANDAETDVGIAASAEKVMESQIATYKYLKKHTTIPVPEVYATNARQNVEVGAPYMLLTYIHGTVADAFELEDVAASRLLKQMADMMVELAACKFDRIGCIFTNDTGDFEIGTLLETDSGPYKTAKEFYEAISEHRFHLYADQHLANNTEATHDTGLHLPFLFNNLMPMFSNSAVDDGPFGLTNTDFGFHNILIDEKMNIVGLIDCDSIMAAPIHVVAQPPRFCGVNIAIPGIKDTNPFVVEFAAKSREKFDAFVELVAAAEKNTDVATPISKAMHSDGAMLVAGLDGYTGLQGWRNMDWINGYWYLYYRRLRGPSAAVEFLAADTGYVDENEDGGDEEEEQEDIQMNTQNQATANEATTMQGKLKHADSLIEATIGDESKEVFPGAAPWDKVGHMKGSEEIGPHKEHIDKQTVIEEVKQESLMRLESEVREKLVADLKEDLMITLEKDLMRGVKKALKEELKQELWLELKADLADARKLAHYEAGLETKGAKAIEASQVSEDIVKEDRTDEQGLDVKEVSHQIPNNEEDEAKPVKEEPVHGV